MTFLQDIWFGFILSVAVACLLSGRFAPWSDFDDLLFQLFKYIRIAIGKQDEPEESVWSASSPERVRMLKFAAFGAMLVALFPLHYWFSTEWFVDFFWKIIEIVRNYIVLAFPRSGDWFGVEGWRAAPYELWEICVFCWALPFFSSSVSNDYRHYSNYSQPTAEMIFRRAHQIGILSLIVGIVGATVLVVFQSALFRLVFELVLSAVLCTLDFLFARSYVKIKRDTDASQHLETLFLINAPVLIAFLCLLLFVNDPDFTGYFYKSHWTSSFVAGASALNLVFASSATLIIKAIQEYRQNQFAKKVSS